MIPQYDLAEITTLTDVARICLQEKDNRTLDATNYGIEWLKEDRALFIKLVHPILYSAIIHECNKIQCATREKILKSVPPVVKEQHAPLPPSPVARRDTLSPAAQQMRQSIVDATKRDTEEYLDFPIRDGLLLRHATRAQVIEGANEYFRNAKTNMIRRNWLNRIHRAMPDAHKTVQDVFTDTALRELYSQAECETI